MITEEYIKDVALMTISSQLYTLELMLGDLLVDKVSVRYSNKMLKADGEMVDTLKGLIDALNKNKEEYEDRG